MAASSLALPSAGLARPSTSTAPFHGHYQTAAQQQQLQQLLQPSTLELQFPAEDPVTWSKAQRAMVDRTIDLGGLDGSPERRAELVEEVRRGCQIGMFYVKNFGVEQAVMDDIRRVAKRYFELPLEEKLKSVLDVKLNARPIGYSFKFSTASTGTATQAVHAPSYREVFRFRDASADYANLWPPSLPEFRARQAQYSGAVDRAVEFVAGLMAEGLGLPASYVGDRYGGLLTSALVVHSPPQQLAPGQVPALALPTHTDGNLFTFNASAGTRGLQFFLDGEWVTAPALLDAAIINLGDDGETMSNGRYHAAYHRVLTSGARSRVSMLTSVELGADEMVAPAAGLGPARYRTRRCASHLEQMVKNYQESRKPSRSKAPLMLDPDSDLDRSKNIYEVDGVDYLAGAPVADWGEILN